MTDKKKPFVVLLDIETSPITAYTWQTYNTNVLKVLEPSKIISISWKELGSSKTNVKCIADYKSYKPGVIDDKDLIKDIWQVLDKADVVIGHHSDSFDLKKLNSRFVVHGLTAPSPFESVDTKKQASKHFRFDSNSLNNLGQFLNLGKKVENGGFDLWVRCIAGDKQAWKLMKEYNVQDVVLLERVYLAIRPYISNHPNLAAIAGGEAGECKCPACTSTNLSKRGFSVTKTGKKQRLQCGDCGAWSLGLWRRNGSEPVAEGRKRNGT